MANFRQKKKVLITGINGFVGRHLAEYIFKAQKNVRIYGCDLKKPKIQIKNTKIFNLDIRNKKQVNNLIKKIRPDIVFHLAAVSSSEKCEKDKKACFEVNVNGTKNLLEALVKYCPDSVALIPSSSEVYGIPKPKTKNQKLKTQIKNIKISENWPINPQSSYALTKMRQEMLGQQYYRHYGLKVILLRTFNILGEREIGDELDICTKIAKRISQAENGREKNEILPVFQNNIRDFIDIGDVVGAYWLAVNLCKPGEIYNICGGKGFKLGDIFNKLRDFSKKNFKIKDYFKIIDDESPSVLIGDNAKFKKAAGWKPKIDILNKTIPEMLKWWRKKIKN